VKILILPSLCTPESGSAVLTARNLADLFRIEGIPCAVCSDPASSFHGVSFYSAPRPVYSLYGGTGRSYEEYMKACGALNHTYLSSDYQAVSEAVRKFEPDLLIEISRPAAHAVAAESDIPLFSVVSVSEYRNQIFDASLLNGLNEFLSEHHLEQVLRLNALSRMSSLRLAFGPDLFQPFSASESIVRFGMPCIEPLPCRIENRLSIVFAESEQAPFQIRRIIRDAFLGAPYEVSVFLRDSQMKRKQNIRPVNRFRLSSVNGSRVCIHDGTDALTQYAIALGIPQIIIHDSSYMRQWNAAALRHSGAGLAIPETELTMERLYETYRQVCADDLFTENARRLKKEADALGDLSGLMNCLPR